MPSLPPSNQIDDDDRSQIDLFADPEDYYPPSPPPTTQTYNLLTHPNQHLTLHLVGHSPLEAHHLWNGSRVVAEYLEQNADLVLGRAVLELGAGAGLPSLVCGLILGASCTVVTDFPDADLVQNLWRNVDENRARLGGDGGVVGAGSIGIGNKGKSEGKVVADGYVWGADPAPLLAHLPPPPPPPPPPLSSSACPSTSLPPSPPSPKFDVLILADLLFRHSEHSKLVDTILWTLSQENPDAVALVFFTSYRPWLRHKDLVFFDLAREKGLEVELILERKMERPLFVDDPGDVEVLKTVGGYAVRWPRGKEKEQERQVDEILAEP